MQGKQKLDGHLKIELEENKSVKTTIIVFWPQFKLVMIKLIRSDLEHSCTQQDETHDERKTSVTTDSSLTLACFIHTRTPNLLEKQMKEYYAEIIA